MKSRDQKTSGGDGAPGAYRTPEMVSMNSADLLEILGPAQGYGAGPGSSGKSVSESGLPGYRKG